MRRCVLVMVVTMVMVLAGCAGEGGAPVPAATPTEVRATATGAAPTHTAAAAPTETAKAAPTYTPTVTRAATATAEPSPTPTPLPPSPTPSTRQYRSEERAVAFAYPSRFTLTEPAGGGRYIAALEGGGVAIQILVDPGDGITEYTDGVIEWFCGEYPPCDVLERQEQALGGESGEKILLRYTENGEQKVRYSTSANHEGYQYGVWLFSTLSEFDQYRDDADTIVRSFEFLATAPDIGELIGTLQIGDITSHYTYSNLEGEPEGKIPVIVHVGHPFTEPPERLLQHRDQFDEPVLLIWSGVLADIASRGPDNCPVDDEEIWAAKSPQFPVLIEQYVKSFNIDEDRIYLTGGSYDGVYAWMLAYDRPDLYAGVVAISAVSYPRQIQEKLQSGAEVVTVVVRGELDQMFPRRLDQERETGRMIESLNPNSKWVLKEGETHAGVGQYWLEYLKYIMGFRRSST